VSQASINLYCIVLKGFFKWLVSQGYTKDNALAMVRVHPQPWTPTAPFSDEEVARLLAVADPMERAVLLLLLDCGLRASELAGLRLGSIDLVAGVITVKGKGGKVRRVGLNKGPKKALRAHFTTQAECNGYLWPEGWDRKKLAAMLDKLGRKAGVAPVFAHRFRHTFATRFLRASGDALALKALLGHESLVMTERYVKTLEQERAVSVHKKHPLVA